MEVGTLGRSPSSISILISALGKQRSAGDDKEQESAGDCTRRLPVLRFRYGRRSTPLSHLAPP